MTLSLIMAGAVLVFMGSATVGAGVVSAYNGYPDSDLPCKWWHSSNTLLQPEYRLHPVYPPQDDYLSGFNSAMQAWNNSDTPVVFDHDTGQTAHTIGVENHGMNGYAGWTDWRCFNFGKRSFTYSYINRGEVPDTASYADKRAVALHELGHYIGLRHSLYAPAIMDVTDAMGDVAQVKLDDECGVNDRYTHSSYPVDCNY